MKILLVGDPHIKVSNLDEGNKINQFVHKLASKSKVDAIYFLGDLFHTHAIKRIEVENLWMESFGLLNTLNIPIIALVGNHDQIGTKEKEEFNSLNVFHNKWENIIIINKPTNINNIAFIPYTRDHSGLINSANKLYEEGATNLLIAHQTFVGATYDNGFYAEDGIDSSLIPQKEIVCGHIHKTQQYGKCFYPGTPKWDTMTDANADKGVWIIDYNGEAILDKKFISTSKVVTPIIKIIVNEGDEEPKLNPKVKNYIEFHGKSSWISKMKNKYKGKACIKGVPKDRKMTAINSGELMQFTSFLESHFEPIDGIHKEQINNYLRGLNVGI